MYFEVVSLYALSNPMANPIISVTASKLSIDFNIDYICWTNKKVGPPVLTSVAEVELLTTQLLLLVRDCSQLYKSKS